MTPLELVAKLKEARGKATPVVEWYARPFEQCIKGPYNRWLVLTGPAQRHPKGFHGSINEDIEWAALALNSEKALCDTVTRLVEALQLCHRITLDKYSNDPEWVRINIKGAVHQALKDVGMVSKETLEETRYISERTERERRREERMEVPFVDRAIAQSEENSRILDAGGGTTSMEELFCAMVKCGLAVMKGVCACGQLNDEYVCVPCEVRREWERLAREGLEGK